MSRNSQLMIEDQGPWSRLIFHPRFETFGGFVVLLNFMVMTMETHATATADDLVLDLVKLANKTFLGYYTAELILRMCVTRLKFFAVGWNILDFTIVVIGWSSEMLEAFDVNAGMDQITMLKGLRMLRLLRLVRLFVAFHELYVLIAGIGRCMKTLLWASGLIFLVLNVWAILSVEFLNQRVQELVPSGVFNTCYWCDNAFENIWFANLTWFQIISTSDWTVIGRPLAEEFFWTFVCFVLCVFVVVWGLLNLIVAAIVDANIAAREDDVATAAKLAEQAYDLSWARFETIVRLMDTDGNGDISVQEFTDFLSDSDELKQYLTVMGIQEVDVETLLRLMDVDDNGSLSCEEFIEQFTMLKTLVEKTSLYVLMKMSQNILDKLVQQSREMQSFHADLSSKLIASQNSPQASEVGSTGRPAAMTTPAQTPRTTAHPKMMPSGWYYFGASLPPEASAWCKAIDPTGELTSIFLACNEPKEVAVATNGPNFQPIPSNSMAVVRAPDPSRPRADSIYRTKHFDVRAPRGELTCDSTGSIEPSNLQGGATPVRTLQTLAESFRQNGDGLRHYLGKSTSDHPRVECARPAKITSPRCSTLVDESECKHGIRRI